MYFNLIVGILILFLVFFMLQEYFDYVPDSDYTVPLTEETFKTEKPKYTTEIKPEKMTYNTQYKYIIPLNREDKFSSVFYEESFIKNISL